MYSDYGEQTTVARYFGSTWTQSIQQDYQGKPVYSFGYGEQFISENRNLDICVADSRAHVMVVSAAGKLRFRYTGPSSSPPDWHHHRQPGKHPHIRLSLYLRHRQGRTPSSIHQKMWVTASIGFMCGL